MTKAIDNGEKFVVIGCLDVTHRKKLVELGYKIQLGAKNWHRYKGNNYTLDIKKFIIWRDDTFEDKYDTDLNAFYFTGTLGNKYIYTVPYHPETNPIEEFFSQFKHYIKLESPQSYEEIVKVGKGVLKNKISKKHLENYIGHLYMRVKSKAKH
jgi:hypothetical protein